MDRYLLLLHVLGACVWTGGHLVLTLSVLPSALRSGQLGPLKDFEARFERVGIPALLVQIVTGFLLGKSYVGGVAGMFQFRDFASSHVAIKWILLGLTLALAVHARLRLVPRLGQENVRQLAFHIVAVTVLSVAFVVVGVSLHVGGF